MEGNLIAYASIEGGICPLAYRRCAGRFEEGQFEETCCGDYHECAYLRSLQPHLLNVQKHTIGKIIPMTLGVEE